MIELTDNCYRLPWTSDDNPNGWIEPTTYCQLKCPGCYRGIDQDDHLPKHVEFSELVSQINWMVGNRNIQTLSIAGGDPLLYPQLKELVSYASAKGLRSMIYTNGIALDEELLIELKECGAVQMVIHIDRFQIRKGKRLTDNDVEELKFHFCEMFRKVKGINLGFIQPISRDCLQILDSMNQFFIANRDIINLVVYTLYREICWLHNKKPEIDTSITMEDVALALKEKESYQPAAYLPGRIRTSEPSWLFSFSIGNSNQIVGFMDGKLYSTLQKRYYKRNGRHLFISRKNRVRLSGLIKLIGLQSVRKIFLNIISSRFPIKNGLYFQTCLILRGPIKNGQEWDLCDGCPDAMFNGKELVPSCILNDNRSGKP